MVIEGLKHCLDAVLFLQLCQFAQSPAPSFNFAANRPFQISAFDLSQFYDLEWRVTKFGVNLRENEIIWIIWWT